MFLIPAQGSFGPTVASLASLKLATLVRLHLNYPNSRLIWPNYSIVGIVEVDNSGSGFRYWSFKMKSIVLITFENIWRCVQPLIVVGIAVKIFSDTVSSSKFKSRIQFLPLGARLHFLDDICCAMFSVW